jgi:internalin A
MPQMGQLLSPQWITARSGILALAGTEPQISYERFEEICLAHGVGPEEAAALAAMLHIPGLIVYYRDDEGLRDFVVLNLECLTKAISYVLEDARTRQSGGIIDHARLRQIWQRPPEGTGYPDRHHPYFLRLMEKFDISYRLEDDPYRSLVAQLTPRRRPALPWDVQAEPRGGVRRLALACRLSEPVPGLISWLTVRHHRAATGLHWRDGVFLRHPIAAYASEALIELAASDLLTLEVRAPSPDYFFNVLRDSIEDLTTRRWPGLNYELLIPCPGATADRTRCAATIPMDDLRVYREEGETRYLCTRCRTRHDITALLTGFRGQELAPHLDQIHAGLTQISNELGSLSATAAQTADLMHKILRAVTTEITDCPRLFTLTSRDSAGLDRLKPGQKHYRFVLWCEHPGHWHSWPAATYDITQAADWVIRIAPAITIMIKILQLATPIAVAVTGLALTPGQIQDSQNEIQLATALINALPTASMGQAAEPGTIQSDRQLTPAQGQAWRAARELIFEHDPARAFGDLRRVQAPSGEFLWICPHHYAEYDPGLPAIPSE